MEALNDDHEIEPTGLPVGISINNLTKIFNPRVGYNEWYDHMLSFYRAVNRE